MAASQGYFGLLILLIYFGNTHGGKHTLIAPQIIREGVFETVVLNLHGINGQVTVSASINLGGVVTETYPNKDATLPILMKVRYLKPIDAPETNRRQYAELIVRATQGGQVVYSETLRMRLVESSGYLHVQTDRPIYRPEEIVKIRVAALNQEQGPELDRKVEIVVRIPQDKIGVEKMEKKMPEKKFIETNYALPEFPEFGIWSIEARYTNEKVTKWSTTTFAVRPYVLPTFNVQLKLNSPFILVKKDMSETKISGTITSRYSYGKTVSGAYFLVAKLKRPGYKKPVIFYQFPDDMQKEAKIFGGKQDFEIKATEVLKILQPDEGFTTLQEEGATITIEASVTGKAEGVVEVDVSSPIVFVVSPYEIDISRMSRYYTPGTAFEIKVDVLDSVTKRPLSDVEVVLTDGSGKKEFEQRSDENGQINEKINMDAIVNKKTFKIVTRDFEVPEENEASVGFILHPYNSKSKSLLQLSAVNKIAKVGDNSFGIDAWFNQKATELRYLLLSRGAIITAGIHTPELNVLQTNFKLAITGELVPSFRLFVYYFFGDEIVSNSLWVDVEDACNKELKVTVPAQVAPGDHVQVKYSGSPGAIIGVSAVDRAAYFLYDESRLTRHGVFEKLEQYDEGCVREGGKNAQHVFEEGGLQLVGGPYTAKEDFINHCQPSGAGKKRRKREVLESVAAKFEKDAELLGCQLDGTLGNLAGLSCDERAKQVQKQQSYECAELFYESCKNYTRLSKIGRTAARSASGNARANKAIAAAARSNFEESMLWRTLTLDGNGNRDHLVIAKDSITTFEFDTISMHRGDGFCVAETQNMTIFKDVFIQLKVPYSLKRGEQAELRASVFNYGHRSQKLTVQVKVGKDLCSHYREGKFTDIITFDVSPNSASTTSFNVLPLRVPENEKVEIEVKAVDPSNNVLDHIKVSVLVEPEGQIKDVKGTKAIDLKNKPPGTLERFFIELQFPERYTVGTRKCWLYTYTNFMGPIIEFDPVTKQPKNDIKNIIRMPGGCGEQTMLSMGPNVYAHRYLRSIGRMKDGSPEEAGSIAKMKSGFANELKYRSTKYGVWSVFPRHDPSVWLNAYVNKVFAQARQFYIEMDVTPICTSIAWLLTKQEADGGFNSGARVIHQEMHGAVGSKLSLSAYVMMSLVESQPLCGNLQKGVETAIMNAIKYLKNNENDRQMEQPYALALVACAMARANPTDPFTVRMIKKLRSKMQYSEDNRLAFWKGAPLAQIQGTNTHDYWYRRKPLAIDVEATGYALCALIIGHTGDFTQDIGDTTRKIVLWLIEQRDENGAFSTTQDTVVGLQALAEYMIWSSVVEPPSKEVKIDLTLSSENGSAWFDKPERRHLDESNENFTTPIEIPQSVIDSGRVEVIAQGEGDGSISYRCVYRTLVEEGVCHYDITVTTEKEIPQGNVLPGQKQPDILKIIVAVSKPNGLPSGQSIIEVNLISGFEPLENSLQKISSTYVVDGIIQRYEIADQKVILYLPEITKEETKLAFRLRRTVLVAKPEPSSVTVYDYYETSVKCTKFYTLPGKMAELRTTCLDDKGKGQEDMCKCAEGGCVTCRTRDQQLEKTACLPELGKDCVICDDPSQCYNLTEIACISNYVYEINVTHTIGDSSGVFVEFEAEILTVYKKGSDFTAKSREKRNFMTRNDCYENCRDPGLALNKAGKDTKMIEEGRVILIFGNLVEKALDKNGVPTSKYRMGEGTYIERMIPEDKCKSANEKVEEKCKKKKKKDKDKKDKKDKKDDKKDKDKEEECKKALAMSQSCSNLKQLRRRLIKGCDKP